MTNLIRNEKYSCNEKPLNGPNLSAKTTIYPISKYVRKSKIMF
jgi:hypothetical protein